MSSSLLRDWTLTANGAVVSVGGHTYTYHHAAADHVCQFFELFLTHTSGTFAGKPFTLEPWQRWYLSELFGWKRPDGTRRYRQTFLFIPRKNGKTTLQAGVALYLLCADGERKAEVYAAAADRDQASICFNMAKSMVQGSPRLASMIQCFKYSLVHTASGSVFKAISADGDTKHGYSSHGNMIDELHCHKKRELYDALKTSTAVRAQPLTMMATTAGIGRTSLCYEVYTYAKNVAQGIVEDGEFLPLLFEPEEGADWTDPEQWKFCNPNLGVTVSEQYLASEMNKARVLPSEENVFKRLRLNIWTEQAERWIPMDMWDDSAQGEPVYELAHMKGRRCYVGLDLSSVSDITAMVGVLPRDDEPGVVDVLCHFWCPGESLERRTERDGVPYTTWEREGLIEKTDKRSIDQDRIFEVISEWASVMDVQEWAVDPYSARSLIDRMAERDMVVFEHRQGFLSLSPAAKCFQGAVMDGVIRHGGHPVLRWMVANAAIEEDPAGNIKPSKRKATEKIDGVVALVMALGRAVTNSQQTGYYDDHGGVGLYTI